MNENDERPAMMRRRYTVSDRVLAANRRNLELARQAEPARRYRATERRRPAWLVNLEKGRALLRETRLSPDGYPRSENRNSKIETRNSEIGNKPEFVS